MSERLERLINLVIALRETRRPMTAEQIHTRVAGYGQDDHAAFRRMFERDKAALRDLGVPIEIEKFDALHEDVGYRIDPARYELPPLALDPDELTALAVAVRATGLGDDAGRGLHKLAVDVDADAAPGGGPDPPLEVALDAPHRDTLLEAQRERIRVRFDYRPADRPAAPRTLDPHALVHRTGRWYVVGYDHDREDRRAFRLDRIASAVVADSEPGAFDSPPQIDVEDVVPRTSRSGPVTAEVAASGEVAWQVARRARGGGASYDRHGEEWRRYTVPVPDTERFVRWVLSFGADVEVLGPEELRAATLAALDRVVADHRAVGKDRR